MDVIHECHRDDRAAEAHHQREERQHRPDPVVGLVQLVLRSVQLAVELGDLLLVRGVGVDDEPVGFTTRERRSDDRLGHSLSVQSSGLGLLCVLVRVGDGEEADNGHNHQRQNDTDGARKHLANHERSFHYGSANSR